MENDFNNDMAHYYRQLAMIENSLLPQSLKSRPPSSGKTFLKPKIQAVDNAIKFGRKNSDKQIRLNKKIESKQEIDSNNSSQSGLPLKYFADLNESQINKRIINNSSGTSKQSSQRVILEICEDGADFQSQSYQNNKQSIQIERNNFKKLQIVRQETQLVKRQQEKRNSQESTQIMNANQASEQLIAQLALRNRVYETVQKNIKNRNPDIGKEWQNIWNRYTLYQKVIEKLGKFTISLN